MEKGEQNQWITFLYTLAPPCGVVEKFTPSLREATTDMACNKIIDTGVKRGKKIIILVLT